MFLLFYTMPVHESDIFLKTLILKAIIFLTQLEGRRRMTNRESVFGFCQNHLCIFRSTVSILTSEQTRARPGPIIRAT